MIKWDLRIKAIENGWTISYEEEAGDGSINQVETCFEIEAKCDYDKAKIKAFQAVLWSVLERFDMMGSKYDAKRLRIKLEKTAK